MMWDEKRVLRYVEAPVQESLELEYKGKGALVNSEDAKTKIARSVSAMANSAGGVIIYGIAEDKEKNSISLDLINFKEFSKERLEDIINSRIQPKIDNLTIYPIRIGQNQDEGVYVIEIPQSHTAHQANYYYYKRHNFKSVPMVDYEVRDVMARRQHTKIDLSFQLTPFYEIQGIKIWHLNAYAQNIGKKMAHYVNAIVDIPDTFLPRESLTSGLTIGDSILLTGHGRSTYVKDTVKYYTHYFENKDNEEFMPILPMPVWFKLSDVRINKLREDNPAYILGELKHQLIYWEVYADDSPPQKGEIFMDEIKVVDRYGRPL